MLNQKVLNWLASHDTGLSSRAIVAWLERDATVAAMDNNRFAHPQDPADLGRCIRLLDIEPSYRWRIREMASVSPEWARLVEEWDELERLYREELPNGTAPKCYNLMRSLIENRPLSELEAEAERLNQLRKSMRRRKR